MLQLPQVARLITPTPREGTTLSSRSSRCLWVTLPRQLCGIMMGHLIASLCLITDLRRNELPLAKRIPVQTVSPLLTKKWLTTAQQMSRRSLQRCSSLRHRKHSLPSLRLSLEARTSKMRPVKWHHRSHLQGRVDVLRQRCHLWNSSQVELILISSSQPKLNMKASSIAMLRT